MYSSRACPCTGNPIVRQNRNIKIFTDSGSDPPFSPMPILKQFKLLSTYVMYYVLLGNFYQLIQSADVFSEWLFILQVVTGSIICPANDIQCRFTDELREMTDNKTVEDQTTILLQQS